MALETKLNLAPSTVTALQSLIQMNIDSRDGLRACAKDSQDMTLTSLFSSLADDRERQANELSRFVSYNGEKPNRDGSIVAAVHRTWVKCREALSSDDAYALLAEAERGEDHIKQAYEDALHETSGSAMNDVLMRQLVDVKLAHDRIRDLRDEAKDRS